ncbi:MAG TPA: imidazole glycerol phosphate synthase subunit HisH [Solirubrobacteraceae bacterium]|nr:imidazole glycerol phosphate synthase subunit HisH [Solirubrobacteraceae bacterium]
MTATIAVVDYGMGNRRSVEKALAHVGARVILSGEPSVLRSAAGLVVPGVGAFPRGMQELRARGLDTLLRSRLQDGVPVLGVCLGMQLFMEGSDELGGAEGLGWVRGQVRHLAPSGSEKLPHIGWNEVCWTAPSPLRDGLPDRSAFYHVHSYAVVPAHADAVLARADYGGEFVTAVQREPFFGVQFHPEKSSVHGLRVLANFLACCTAGAPAVAA